MAAIHFTLIPIPIPLKTTKNSFFPVRNFRISASLIPSNSSFSANFQEKPAECQSPEPDTEYSIKLSFAKAKASKDSINSNPTISELDAVNEDGVNKEVPLAVKLALQKAREYKERKGAVGSQGTISVNVDKIPLVESDGIDQRNDGLTSDEVKDVGGDKDVPLAAKLALEKAAEYKKNKGILGSNYEGTGGSETLDSGNVYLKLLITLV